MIDSSDAIISYSCDDDYTLNEDSNKCSKTETKAAKIDNPCSSGYKLNNGKCTKTITTDVIETRSCLGDGTISGDVCKYREVKAPTVKTGCPSGNYYEVDGACYR